jgi:predicted ATPase
MTVCVIWVKFFISCDLDYMIDVWKHYFIERAIKVWNGLLAKQNDLCRVKRFVTFLDKVYLSKISLFPYTASDFKK